MLLFEVCVDTFAAKQSSSNKDNKVKKEQVIFKWFSIVCKSVQNHIKPTRVQTVCS